MGRGKRTMAKGIEIKATEEDFKEYMKLRWKFGFDLDITDAECQLMKKRFLEPKKVLFG